MYQTKNLERGFFSARGRNTRKHDRCWRAKNQVEQPQAASKAKRDYSIGKWKHEHVSPAKKKPIKHPLKGSKINKEKYGVKIPRCWAFALLKRLQDAA